MSRALPISFYLLLFFGLIIANILVYRAIFAPRVLQVSILEVGKGDAILIRTPNNKTLLVDAGPDASILRALGTALPEWQREIDAIALTGSKTAETGGLPEVINKYHVQTILHFGTDISYGTSLVLDGAHIDIVAPATLIIDYGATSISISSSTPADTFISDGKTVTKIK